MIVLLIDTVVRSQTIVDILEKECDDLGARVLRQCKVKAVTKSDKGFCVVFLEESSADADITKVLDCDRVIVATGSAKYVESKIVM